MSETKFKLEVGKVYLTRQGDTVFIKGKREDSIWPFIDEFGGSYKESGSIIDETQASPFDLVKEAQ